MTQTNDPHPGTTGRRMHLVAFLKAGPTAHHNGAWRHPEADLNIFAPPWYEHIARVLEQGRFDSLFFADTLGLYDLFGGSFATILRHGGQMGFLDPIPLLSIISRVTSHIGLGATLSSTFYPPYHLARTLGTLDLLSGGRVAWNVVASHGHLEAQNFGFEKLPDRDSRYDYADEVVEAVCRLWESWDADALVLDKQRGIYADPDKVHYVNYQGRWIKTRGPLTVPRSPQGRPVIMQAGSSPRGRDFAARWGELVFTLQHSKTEMQAFYRDLKARVVRQGRAPQDCLILPSVDPIIGETDAIARERQAYVNDLVQTEAGMAMMSGHIGVDLSRFPADQPLADMQLEAGSRGSLDVILQGTEAQGLTLGEAARRFATSELCPQIVGSPESVADQLQDLFESQACDGFILTPTLMPGMFEQFCRAVVPVLQARGLFRRDYAGTTLRETLRD
jgi:FMN-dependent oxidoreductase (nitrilotriacetate monooxygenase family)